MIREDSWLDLAHEPAIRATGLERIQERAPRLRVTVELSDERLRLGIGKATLDIVPTRTGSDRAGQRTGDALILPPAARDANAIITALSRAAEAEIPPRPHAPGFCPPLAVTLLGFHATAGRSSVVWVSIEPEAPDGGSSGLRFHVLISPGKATGWLHVELPRGAASRAKLLGFFALAIRDGWAPRRTPETDLRCASERPWLTTTKLEVPAGVDLDAAVWGGSALFATRSDDHTTVLVRIEGPGRSAEVARLETPDVAFYPSPTGAYVLLETRRGAPHPLGSNLTKGHAARELLDVATGQRTPLVEKHELFTFGDTSGAARWSADGRLLAMSGSSSLAGGTRYAVLVYDVAAGVFIDVTPLDGTFFLSHWDGPALWLRGGSSADALAFRWEPGRSGPRADACLGQASPSGRFALLPAADRTRVIDRRLGAFAPSLPASLAGRFWAGDAWVTEEDEPRVFDLAADRYRYLAPASRVLRPNLSETAPRAIFHDGTDWHWGSAPELGAGGGSAAIPPAEAAVRRALAERRARRIEEASIVAEEDPSGEARRALAALEARLRAEAALEGGNAKGADGSDDAVEAALTQYEAAGREAPDFYEALHNCEVALARLGRSDERLRVAAYLCERFPISSEAWLTRSITLQKAGDTAAALAAVERALALDAEGVDLAHRRARTVDLLHQRACVHVARGHIDAAITDVSAILAMEPSARERLAEDEDLAPLRSNPLLRSAPAKRRARR